MWFIGASCFIRRFAIDAPLAYLEKLNPEQRRAVEHGVRVKELSSLRSLQRIWRMCVRGPEQNGR
jgi:hypothetical protein